MITQDDINTALGQAAGAALEAAGLAAEWTRPDTRRPVVRPSYRVDVSLADDMGAEDYAERGVDVEIYYYPLDAEQPRDELARAAETLRVLLRTGVTVGGVVLEVAGAVDSDATDGVLALMLRLEWIETTEDEGEPMETLIYNEEVITHGSDNAED